MPQPKKARRQLVGTGREEDDRFVRQDPIFQEILPPGVELDDNPGVFHALTAIEDMRAWGVTVTPEIALACLKAHNLKWAQGEWYDREQGAIRQEHQHPPIVYYMRLGQLVKIGFTTNLTKRLGVINPEEVMVTEPGGREREQQRHREFDALRVHGEWFRLAAPLTDHIEAVRREAAGE